MGKHLYKLGLRKCYSCKNIKPLDTKNFYADKRTNIGFKFMCIPCNLELLSTIKKTKRANYRLKVLKVLGQKCAKCKVTNSNPSFFDIDHIIPVRSGRGKRRYHLSRIKEYMVLCPNCHRIKTINENGFN